MHVSCSNCGARYAVDPTAIGPTGRTVQCARCNHRWFQKIEPPIPRPETPKVVPEPAPDVMIQPTTPGSGLPVPAPPRRKPLLGRLRERLGNLSAGTWFGLAASLIVLLGAVAFVYRGELRDRLPPQWRTVLGFEGLGLNGRAKLALDLAASRIDFVDGRYVVTGQIVNNGTAAGSTRSLRLTFRAGEQVVGERTVPLAEGPIAPGARARFSLPLDDPPAGTTNIVPTID
ncbi:MAG: zinc-ribbon domain-containing protein [Alphaproteobacteria bacterium]|nr:zinc-ribbon domain-containing protein [Alphaproteobacteria bacterium]